MARGLRRADGFFDGGGVTPSPTPSLQLYKRTYGAVVYLVDVDGKLVTDDTVYVEVGASGNPNACVLSLCSQNQELSDIIAAWGKTSAVFSSQELGTTDYTITIGEDIIDIVGEVATPAPTTYSPSIESITPTLPNTLYETITVEMTAPVDKREVLSNLKAKLYNKNSGETRDASVYENNGRLLMGTDDTHTDFELQLSGTTISITDNSAGHGSYTVTEITWGV